LSWQKPSIFVVGAVVLSAILLQAGNGLLITLIPLRMTQGGLPTTDVGLVATGYGIGFLIGCLFATKLVRSVGHIRAFAALAAVMASGTLALHITADLIVWIIVRGATGFCLAGLTTVIESWINERTPQSSRGSVLSMYLLSTKLAMGGGPLILGYGDIMGPAFLMLISAFCSLSLVPLTLTRGPSPSLPSTQRLTVPALYKIAPAAVVGCVVVGLTNGAVIGLTPAYAASINLNATTIALMMAGLQVGGLAFQWPLGWLSDRIDRRRVIAITAAAVALTSLAISFLTDMPAIVQIALFGAWGGLSLSVYAVCLAHAADRAPRNLMVAMSSSLLLAWAAGAVVGPALASYVMQQIGTQGLFYYATATMAALALFVLVRTQLRAEHPGTEKEVFVSLPASSPLISHLDPRISDDMAETATEDLGAGKTAETTDETDAAL